MESPAFARSLFLDISSRFLRSAASKSSFFRSALILACAASSDSAVFFDGFDEPAEVNSLVIRGSADAGCRQNYPECGHHMSKYRPQVKFVHPRLCQVALHEVHKLSSSSVIVTWGACLTLHYSRGGAGDGGKAGVHHHEGVGGAHGEHGVQVLEVGHRVEVAGRVVLQLPDGDHQVRNLSGRGKAL